MRCAPRSSRRSSCRSRHVPSDLLAGEIQAFVKTRLRARISARGRVHRAHADDDDRQVIRRLLGRKLIGHVRRVHCSAARDFFFFFFCAGMRRFFFFEHAQRLGAADGGAAGGFERAGEPERRLAAGTELISRSASTSRSRQTWSIIGWFSSAQESARVTLSSSSSSCVTSSSSCTPGEKRAKLSS